MWLLLGLLAWPLVEIALFVWIGGAIGVWATLAWVLLSAGLGMAVMRVSAARSAVGLQDGLRQIRSGDPGAQLAGGIFGLLAGGLLVLPGFLTDALGLLLLIPQVQRGLARAALARAVVVRAAPMRRSDVIDGEWQEVPPETARRLDGSPGGQRHGSGWTRDQP